jgi:hypothetical protein
MQEKIIAAALGAALTWVGTSLTLVGRVDAIEKSLVRIEQAIYAKGPTK